jgi:hypothetical protein
MPPAAAIGATSSISARSTVTLEELVDRAAIQDVLTSYARGVDRLDLARVRACYHHDARHEGMFRGGPDEFVARLADASFLPAFAWTTHQLGQQAIELDGAVAWTETYCIAYHRGTARHVWGEQDVTIGVRYVDRLEKRDGRWAIAHRRVVHDWVRAEPIGAGVDFGPGAPWGRRDRTDPSYDRS